MELIVPKMVTFLSFVFGFFLIFFLISWMRACRIGQKRKDFQKYLQNYFLSQENQELEFLLSYLKKECFFLEFYHWFDGLSKKDQERFLKVVGEFLLQLLPFVRTASIRYQVLFLKFLTQYPKCMEGKDNPLLSYMAESAISTHFAIRDWAFLGINRFGNSTLLRKTLLLMNQHVEEHNAKLITNSLLQFQGDAKLLKEFIGKDIKKYRDCYCIACIDYLGYQKLDISSAILSFLQDNKKDKEVHIACIRYFAQVVYKKAVPVLYEMIKNDVLSWEEAAIAAKALGNYPSKETNNHLLAALGSYSWYVRHNAAGSLVKNNRREVVKEMLRQINDKYAYEALKYQLQLFEKGN